MFCGDLMCVTSSLVMNLTCESTDPGVIALGWEFQDKQCPINSYNVTWSFESLWSDDKGDVFSCLVVFFVLCIIITTLML